MSNEPHAFNDGRLLRLKKLRARSSGETMKGAGSRPSTKDITVEIDGLGIFNEFLAPLVDLIDLVFGDAIKGEISAALKAGAQRSAEERAPLLLPAVSAMGLS